MSSSGRTFDGRASRFFEIQHTIAPYSKDFGEKLLSVLKLKLQCKSPLSQNLPTISRLGHKARRPAVRFVDHFSNRKTERELGSGERLELIARGISETVNQHLDSWVCSDPY